MIERIERSEVGAHFTEATVIPFTDTRHFERDGFSGDVFVAKEAAMGFTALRVEVNGEHPLKEILKGSTRSYYVLEGEGTFTLNDEDPQEVSSGRLIVIPPENKYKYEGTMSLLEFNVSPSNGFRDRLVTSEPLAEPAEPSERELANQLRREQRASLAQDLAELFRRGYALTHKDLATIVPSYGYSSTSLGARLSYGFRDLVASFGANVGDTKYKNRVIYYNYMLPEDENGIQKTKAKIAADIAKNSGSTSGQ